MDDGTAGTPVLLTFALHLLIPTSFALVSRKLLRVESPVRSTGFWTFMTLDLALIVPTLVSLQTRNPDWYFLYLWEIGAYRWQLSLVHLPFVAMGVAVFFGVRKLLIKRPQRWTGPVIMLSAFAVSTFTLLLGWGRMGLVGSPEEIVSETGGRLLLDTSIGFLVLGVLTVVTIGWAITLWRLFLYVRATPVSPRFLGSVPVRDGQTKALARGESVEPPAKIKAKAKAN